MEHQFNIFVAEKYGIIEAVLIHNFRFWTNKNKENDTNFFDGRYWTYNTIVAFCDLFPYMTRHQVGYALKKLEDAGVLHKGNFNKKKFDRTMWYSLSEDIENYYRPHILDSKQTPELQSVIPISENSEMHSPNFGNGFPEIQQPIPYTSTDSKQHISSADELKQSKIDEAALKQLFKEKMKEKKILDAAEKKARKNERQPDFLWQTYIRTWIDFNENTIKFTPVINSRELSSLRKIVDTLKARTEKQGKVWDEKSSAARLKTFFLQAHGKDNWMRNNFTLTNCNNQINSIIKIVEHGKQQDDKHKSNQKSSGAISFADSIREKFDTGGQGTTHD